MVAPLNLAHRNLLVPSNSFGRFQQLNRILLIGQIFACNQIFQWDLFFRYSQTFLQLWHMEHIVYNREPWGQFQLIGHFDLLLQDFKQSNKSGGKLSSNFESTKDSHRWHLEIYIISNFKSQISSPTVYITFLAWLSNLEIFSHYTDLLLSVLYNVGSKNLSFSSLILECRSSTSSII
jgi:hypothetical protein